MEARRVCGVRNSMLTNMIAANFQDIFFGAWVHITSYFQNVIQNNLQTPNIVISVHPHW